VAAIKRLQPFDGCTWTRIIRDGSNQDKHWALNVTSTAHSGWFEFDPPISSADAQAFAEGKVNVKHTPTIDVTFANGPSVRQTLESLESEVRAVLEVFELDFERTSTVNDQA
jgi:hypothetical protein